MLRARIAVALICLLVAGCAHQPSVVASYDNPGFFLGVWHGTIAPLALIAHLFDGSVRVYAFPNAGGWYDFGFIVGIAGISGAGVRS